LAISEHGITFSQIPSNRLAALCETPIRLSLNFCLFRVVDPLAAAPDSLSPTNIYAFRNPADLQTFRTGSPRDLNQLLGNLLQRDIAAAFESENGRAAAAILRRDGNRPANRSLYEAAIVFLDDLSRILSVTEASEQDGLAMARPTSAPALDAIHRYGNRVETNPAGVLSEVESLANGRDAVSFLQWLSHFADFHPLPNFAAYLGRLSSERPSPRTVAVIAASEFWHYLLIDDSRIPSTLWSRSTSEEFGRLNSDGALDSSFLTLIRFILADRDYTPEQISRILSSVRRAGSIVR